VLEEFPFMKKKELKECQFLIRQVLEEFPNLSSLVLLELPFQGESVLMVLHPILAKKELMEFQFH